MEKRTEQDDEAKESRRPYISAGLGDRVKMVEDREAKVELEEANAEEDGHLDGNDLWNAWESWTFDLFLEDEAILSSNATLSVSERASERGWETVQMKYLDGGSV